MTPETMRERGRQASTVQKARRAIRNEISSARPRPLSMETLAAVLDDNPTCLGRVMAWDVLGWIYRIEPIHRRNLLRHADVGSDYRLVGELTDRQRGLLAAALRTNAIFDPIGAAA